MKKLAALDVSFVNKVFFPEFKDVRIINMGQCFQWAYIAYHLYDGLELWDMSSHAFVKSTKTGKFYDSETPHGVDDWHKLPATFGGVGCGCFDCSRPAKKYKSLKSYRKFWGYAASKYGVNFEELDKQIKEILKKASKKKSWLSRITRNGRQD